MIRRVRYVVGSLLGLGAGLFGLTSCQLATPFKGPGYDRAAGVVLEGVGDRVHVAITNATVDRATRAPFDDYTRRVIAALPVQEGIVGYSVRSAILGNEVWTMTIWRDVDAMEVFVMSDIHQQAIREGMVAVKTARFLQFDWPTNQVPPPWSEVLRRLESVPLRTYDTAARRAMQEAAR